MKVCRRFLWHWSVFFLQVAGERCVRNRSQQFDSFFPVFTPQTENESFTGGVYFSQRKKKRGRSPGSERLRLLQVSAPSFDGSKNSLKPALESSDPDGLWEICLFSVMRSQLFDCKSTWRKHEGFWGQRGEFLKCKTQ